MGTRRILGIGAALLLTIAWSACGGGSGGGGGGDDGTGVASLKSLADLPTIDLSNYDSSSGTNSNLALGMIKSSNLAKAAGTVESKRLGEGMRAEGGSSRAGCEANMQKQEIFRMSQQVQLDRCYPEAMEKAGFITIPDDAFAYYEIVKPPKDDEDKAKMCEGIPEDRVEELERCLADTEEQGSGGMKMRIGRINGELQIDMCKNDVLENEATYTADGSVYTAGVVRIGTWNGNTESGNFIVRLDLGTTGKVENSIPTLGADSSLSATGNMIGGYGSGKIIFEYVGEDSSNKIIGGFGGNVTDPYTGAESSFTGKTYARFGGETSTGCAKYSFSGEMPGMRVSDMIPYDISADYLDEFLATLSAELGIDINATNYNELLLCPNDDFNPEDFNPTIKPMILAGDDDKCGIVSDGDTECFSISSVANEGDYGETIYSQFFTIIPDTGEGASPYYAEVEGYRIEDLVSTPDAIAFSRNWDCQGTFSEINFETMTDEQRQLAQTAMQTCNAIEQKARGNEGMGGYNCGEQEQANSVDMIASGGGSTETFGPFGGKWKVDANISCPAEVFENIEMMAEYVFVSAVDITNNEYCIPMEGVCEPFAVNGSNIATPNIVWGNATITKITYDGAAPLSAAVEFTPQQGGDACSVAYAKESMEFEREGNGFEGGGEAGMPQACVDAGITEPAVCQQLCMQPENPCGFGPAM